MHTTFAIESGDSPAPGIIPEPVRVHDQRDEPPARPLWFSWPGHARPGEQRANQAGGGVVATPEATILTENEQLAGINADYEQRYGFHDSENYL